MTEFKRTTQAVDEIESLVQQLLDNSAGADAVQRLGQLIGNTVPVIEKLSKKAAETDPLKQTYGPQMREKVQTLASKWSSVEGLARDVLAQKGGSVAEPSQSSAAPPPPPRPATTAVLWEPPRAAQQAQTAAAASSAQNLAYSNSSTAGASTGGTSAAASSPADRRELAAKAAEARLGGSKPSNPAAATGSAVKPNPEAAPRPVPVVARMDALMHLVHCVFLGHGYTKVEDGTGLADSMNSGPIRVRYTHEDRAPVMATYVPVQRHLMTYASHEDIEDCPTRASVMLGMPAASVQAKIDYLLVYPLIYRQCAPSLSAIPPEVLFGLLGNFAIPSLAAVGYTSRAISTAVFDDDLLWWRVCLSLPQSHPLASAVEAAKSLQSDGEVPKGSFKKIVRDEVHRARREAEEERRRREEAERVRRSLQDPLLVQPPRRPQRPFPGGFGTFGGDRDLLPGGGFMPGNPFGGNRDPFGGRGGFGGGGFGGGGFFG
eukprot:TRINITY_DN13213_c0_g2_i1.p1 TRINITY_DN13213_c0_g2~~TRINITY_DN13213_c0_g2_i1.p1  ORF type:complete len:488 (+),score=118.46 TRINITY_DN13213_c0_g2_i1:79-1542(+)